MFFQYNACNVHGEYPNIFGRLGKSKGCHQLYAKSQ